MSNSPVPKRFKRFNTKLESGEAADDHDDEVNDDARLYNLFKKSINTQQRLMQQLLLSRKKRQILTTLDDGPTSGSESEGVIRRKTRNNNTSPGNLLPSPCTNPFLLDEVLDCIFNFLDATEIKACRFVNKQWSYRASMKMKKTGFIVLKTKYAANYMNTIRRSSNLYCMTGFNIYFDGWNNHDINQYHNNMTSLIARLRNIPVTRLNLDGNIGFLVKPPPNAASGVSSPASIVESIRNIDADDEISFLPIFLPQLKELTLHARHEQLSNLKSFQNLILDPALRSNVPFRHLRSLIISCQLGLLPFSISFQADGLLWLLLNHSPNLTSFEFIGKSYSTSPTINLSLCKDLVELLMAAQAKLTRLEHLSLDFKVPQIFRLPEYADGRPQEFLASCPLKSIHLNGVQWRFVGDVWAQHKANLTSLSLGSLMPTIHSDSTIYNELKSSLPKVSTFDMACMPINETFLSCIKTSFVNLKVLKLQNPNEDVLLLLWKDFNNLQVLELNFIEVLDKSWKGVGTRSKVNYHMLNLDSLLSGFSSKVCAMILRNIKENKARLNGICLEPSLDERFGQSSASIRNLKKLQKLAINSQACSWLPYTITEVGVVLVLLRMSSLTSISIDDCDLMDGTMDYINSHISPAMHLSIKSTCGVDPTEYAVAKLCLLN